MSNEKNESVNDVLDGMRVMARTLDKDNEGFTGKALSALADRIEAAFKRDVDCKIAFFEGLFTAIGELRDERDKLKDACRECSVKNTDYAAMRNALKFIGESDVANNATDSAAAAFDAVKQFRELARKALAEKEETK